MYVYNEHVINEEVELFYSTKKLFYHVCSALESYSINLLQLYQSLKSIVFVVISMHQDVPNCNKM